MNDKLKKLTSKLSELIPKSETPQQVYDGLILVMQKQSDYFKYLGPDNVVKLTLYIYSFKTTGKFNVGDTMISSLGFANVFTTEGTEYVKTCESCDGEGELDCEYCDRGEITCERCDGTGEVTCEECDGDGRQMGDGEWEDCEACDGDGEIECGDCGGDGETSCGDCDRGTVECGDCDGTGEIESIDKVDYQSYFIANWNKDITNSCELNLKQNKPALSEYTFDSLRDDYITLSIDNEYAPLDLKVNKMYCTFYDDEPKLYFDLSMQIRSFKETDLRYLYK
jgi:hypothetical protein